jgi:hypothetical protein
MPASEIDYMRAQRYEAWNCWPLLASMAKRRLMTYYFRAVEDNQNSAKAADG